MKKIKLYLLASILLLAIGAAIAQPGKKPTQQKEKPSAKKEIEYLMKESQKSVDDLSPEDKRTVEVSAEIE